MIVFFKKYGNNLLYIKTSINVEVKNRYVHLTLFTNFEK